jgi:hypothetical protein
MEANENRKFDRARPEPAAAPPPVTQPASGALSIPEQIERLDELRRRGVISDEEFGQKKTELLDRM